MTSNKGIKESCWIYYNDDAGLINNLQASIGKYENLTQKVATN